MNQTDHTELEKKKAELQIQIHEIDERLDDEWNCRSCKHLIPSPVNTCRSGFYYNCGHPKQADEKLKEEAGNNFYKTGCTLHEKP